MVQGSPSQGGRWLALLVLRSWEHDAAGLEDALEHVCAHAEGRERGLAMNITLGVVRWRDRLYYWLKRLLNQPLGKLHPDARLILCLGLYQLRFMDRIPSRAVVFETVALCERAGIPWARGLVNGVLRRYDREREALELLPRGNTDKALATRLAHPVWFVHLMRDLRHQALEPYLNANNAIPPLTLRVNRLKCDRAALLSALKAVGAEACESALAPEGVQVEWTGPIPTLPGYSEGWFAVQDEGSQLVALALAPRAGDQVLDTCAAPGGKAMQLATMTGEQGLVVAADNVPRRLARIGETVARLGISGVEPVLWDWLAPKGPRLPQLAHAGDTRLFDRVLVDAPCSGFGVLRRIPEIKWRRKPRDVASYPPRQLELLEAAAAHVRPDGVLVYSVCTPLLAEGPEVIARFLEAHPDWETVDLSSVLDGPIQPLVGADGFLRTWPDLHNCDAFFVARLQPLR